MPVYKRQIDRSFSCFTLPDSIGSFLALFRDFSRRFPGLFRNAASKRSRTMGACSALPLNEALQTF